MKNKFKIVRRGPKWCVRINTKTDEFDREKWPAYAVKEWLDECEIPYEAKKREYITVHAGWWEYEMPAKWKRDYLFDNKEDASWFIFQWSSLNAVD